MPDTQIASGLSGLPRPQIQSALRAAADALESSFLAEMLKEAGVGKPPEGFDGGAGEDQFASFLVEKQADAIVRAGGIGLSDSIFAAMSRAGAE